MGFLVLRSHSFCGCRGGSWRILAHEQFHSWTPVWGITAPHLGPGFQWPVFSLLPSLARQNLVPHLVMLLILLQISRTEDGVSHAGSGAVIMASCKLGCNLQRDQADFCGIQGLSLFWASHQRLFFKVPGVQRFPENGAGQEPRDPSQCCPAAGGRDQHQLCSGSAAAVCACLGSVSDRPLRLGTA